MEDHKPRRLTLMMAVGRLHRIWEEYLRRVAQTLDANVMDVCTTQVECVDETASLEEVCTVLSEKGFKKLPVIADGKLVGSVSRSDIVRHLMSGMVGQA